MSELKARGLGVAGLSYDSPAILADFTRRRGIQFPLLPDAGSKTIQAFGLLNTTIAPTETNYGIPFPGTFIVDVNGIVRRATMYPPSEIYHFVPLNERVAVYQKPFRLTREVVFDASAAGQEKLRDIPDATITGRLEYQACSNVFCFAPASVPLSWTVKIRTLDRERVAR